jgi:ribose-phosphate pyrophosphokinase
MTESLLIALPGNEAMGRRLAEALDAVPIEVAIQKFPDGETYLRYGGEVSGRQAILLCTLDHPDHKFLPLAFAAATARDLGAVSVGFVCPYLAYMRQDRRFKPGEAVTSSYFARLLSSQIDWLVTVDPHLHRRDSLSELYGIPAAAVHVAPLISRWIAQEVENPLLIGPDSESAQWVSAVAQGVRAPYVVLEKIRRGDRDVEVSVPDVARWAGHTPVLVDDIVSTARTMIAAVGHLKEAGMRPPHCVAVHGIFAGTAYEELRAAGTAKIATCNTIPHETNAIDVTALLAQGVRKVSARS